MLLAVVGTVDDVNMCVEVLTKASGDGRTRLARRRTLLIIWSSVAFVPTGCDNQGNDWLFITIGRRVQ